MGLNLNDIASKESKNEKKNSFSDLLTRDIKLPGFGKSKVKRNALFHQELSILLSSGMDLKSSLEILIGETEKEKDIIIYKKISDKIIAGASLSDALKSTGEFTPFEYHNIKIGEETGNLEKVLNLLTKYYMRMLDTRQKIRSAMTYPLMVIVVSIVAVLIMMKFVVPAFSDVYESLGQDLPGMTQAVLKISSNLGIYTIAILCIVALILISSSVIKKRPYYLSKAQKLIIKTPLVGKYIKHLQIEKFFHSLSILLQSKINLVKSFEIMEEMITFLPLKYAIKKIREDLISGISLSDALKKHNLFFESRRISLIKVGEEVNKLEFAINKIESQLEEKTENIAKNFTSTLEPILILIVGAMVGFILIAMYLPIFNLSNAYF